MEICVLVDWVDGPTEDTSELFVTAENERDAILFAIAEWHQEAQQWPNCRITRVWVEPPDTSPAPAIKIFRGCKHAPNTRG